MMISRSTILFLLLAVWCMIVSGDISDTDITVIALTLLIGDFIEWLVIRYYVKPVKL